MPGKKTYEPGNIPLPPPFFTDERAQLLVRQISQMEEHAAHDRKDAFFYLSRAMVRTIPRMLEDPLIYISPQSEGERIGKLLRKSTIELTMYRDEARQRILDLLEKLFRDAVANESVKGRLVEDQKMFEKHALFWQAVVDNYKT